MLTYPLIVWHPDGSAADVTFPYSAFVVAELKRAVPAPLRTYDPDSKTWTVAGRYVSAVYHVLAQVFGEVDVEGSRTGSADRRRPTGGDPYQVLHLLPSAPDEVVTVVYRTLARLHHPDVVGGDTGTMQAINAAVESIREASR